MSRTVLKLPTDYWLKLQLEMAKNRENSEKIINEQNQMIARYKNDIASLQTKNHILQQNLDRNWYDSYERSKRKAVEGKLHAKAQELADLKQYMDYVKAWYKNQIAVLQDNNMVELSNETRKRRDIEAVLEKKEKELYNLGQRIGNLQNEMDMRRRRYEIKIETLELEKRKLHSDWEKIRDVEAKLEIKEQQLSHLMQLHSQTRNDINATADMVNDTQTRYSTRIALHEGENRQMKPILEQRSSHEHLFDDSQGKQINAKLETKERELAEVKHMLKRTKEELDDTKIRLSKVIGDNLTNDNPNIADLSDKNRPTKLQEKYTELYDNQWTDAFEQINVKYKEADKTTIETLLSILIDVSEFCERKAKEQMESLQKCVSMSFSLEYKIPQNVNKMLKDCRKAMAEVSAMKLYELLLIELQQSSSPTAKTAVEVQSFLRECLAICWFMAVQEPPVVLGIPDRHNIQFNSDMYKPYTRSGNEIDFVVWPPLLLYKDGPVLCKGVAQCYEKNMKAERRA